MTTTHTPGLELIDPQAYRAKTLARLGGRNPLDILAQTPGALREMVANTPSATSPRDPGAATPPQAPVTWPAPAADSGHTRCP